MNLVGVGHINKSKALMHPILQSNQIEKLELTEDDIKAFYQTLNFLNLLCPCHKHLHTHQINQMGNV